MPAFATCLNTFLTEATAESHWPGCICCEPTWNETPYGSSPSSRAWISRSAGHLGRAAELAVQRPQGAFAVDQDAAEHLRARRGNGDLFQLRLAVEGVELHAAGVGPGDVGLLLDGVAEGDPLRRDAEREHLGDLAGRGGVEAGALLGQARQDFLRRVGLHGIEHFGERQRAWSARDTSRPPRPGPPPGTGWRDVARSGIARLCRTFSSFPPWPPSPRAAIGHSPK